MLITPDFVFLMMPRAGSTFCGRIIKDLYPADKARTYIKIHSDSLPLWMEWFKALNPPIDLLPTTEFHTRHNYKSDIPDEHKDKPVLGIKREPLDLWASWFNYRFCADSNRDKHDITTFRGYYEHLNETMELNLHRVGLPKYGFCREYHKAMFGEGNGVRYLDFNNLSRELYDYLLEIGYDVPFIIPSAHVNVGAQRASRHWSEFIPEDMVDMILEHEA